jgi:hypothetical protein
MPMRLSRLAAGAVVFCAIATAQQTSGDADLFRASSGETDPVKKLAVLEQWTAQYPDSLYKQQRNLLYMAGYSALALDAAKGTGVAAGERAAHAMIDRADALFASQMMPGGVQENAWKAGRVDFVTQAHGALATIALNGKNYVEAESELMAILELNHSDAATSYRLGATLVAERNPVKYPAAIFHLARVVTVMGPGAVDDSAKKPIEDYLENIYRDYHGSLMGLDEVKMAAMEAWISAGRLDDPEHNGDCAGQIEADEKFASEHPELAVWRTLKARLTAPDGEDYFASDVKGTEIPRLKGKVTAQPDAKTLLLAMDDPAISDATLHLDTALRAQTLAGTELDFTGVPLSFTKTPFMMIFSVEKSKVNGLGR